MDCPPLYKIHILKDLGNGLFKQHQYIHAGDCYNYACRLLCFAFNELSKLESNSVLNLAISLCLNLAACAIKLQAFDGALIFCSMVLQFFPHNAKALFRNAVALKGLKRLPEALSSLEAAASVEPRNKDIIKELNDVRNRQAINLNGKRVVEKSLNFDVRKGKRSAPSQPVLEVGVVGSVIKDESSISSKIMGEASCSALNLDAGCVQDGPGTISNVSMDHDTGSKTHSPTLAHSDCNSKSSLDYMELGSTHIHQFDPLGMNKKVESECIPSFTSTPGSSKFSFTNKKQIHKKLVLSCKDYQTLVLGKKLQLFHKNSGAFMTVRPLSSETFILTGTPREISSREAVVPTSMDIALAEKMKSYVDEEVNPPGVKQPCLSSEMILDYSSKVSEVSMADCQFFFSATKVLSSKRCSQLDRPFTHQCTSHARDRTKSKDTSLMTVRCSSVFCRFRPTTLEIIKCSKRKDECSIHFDTLYHPPRKKRRLCVQSVCNSSYISWLSSSSWASNAPWFEV